MAYFVEHGSVAVKYFKNIFNVRVIALSYKSYVFNSCFTLDLSSSNNVVLLLFCAIKPS